jgi:hypothetical protein
MLEKEAIRHLMEDYFCAVFTVVKLLNPFFSPVANQEREDIQLRDMAAINCQGKTQDTQLRHVYRYLKQRADSRQ